MKPNPSERETVRFAAPCVVPIVFATDHEMANGGQARGGSVSLIETPIRKLGVTCDHVLRDAEESGLLGPNYRTVLGNCRVDLRKRVIARSERLDLLTLDLSEFGREHLSGLGMESYFHAPAVWPPRRPAEDQAVIVVGYPGGARRLHDDGTMSTGFNVVLGQVTEIVNDGDSFRVAFSDDGGEQMPGFEDRPHPSDVGGMSGGIVMQHARWGPVEVPQVLGFVTRDVRDENGRIQMLWCVSALHIQADGSVTEPK